VHDSGGISMLMDLPVLASRAAATLACDASLSVPRLHGAVCGLAVFGVASFPVAELAAALRCEPPDDGAALYEFVDAATRALGAEDLSFAPLLAGDDAPLPERARSLGEWSAGFVAALAGGFAAGLDCPAEGVWESALILPDEIQEIVDDFAAIAEISPASAAESLDHGATEHQLVELEEFVKVGVLLMMSAFDRGATDPTD
jgi:uncharacterized protein